MKRIYFLLVLMFFSAAAFAQYKVGLKLNPGTAWLRSMQTKKAFTELKNDDVQVTDWAPRSLNGFTIGGGGFAEYIKSSKLSFIAELSFNFQNTPYSIVYEKDERDAGGSGPTVRYSSTARIKSFYFSLPVLCKYVALSRLKLYGIGGVNLNFALTPKMISREDSVHTMYSFNTIVSPPAVYPHDMKAKMDQSSKFNLQLVIGGGKTFRFAGRSLDMELRYHFPLLKGAYYTSNTDFYNQALNNKLFTEQGRSDIADASGVSVGDFRNGMVLLSFRYTFKYIDNSEEE